mmetsp:Transcript_25557/g.101896  ORF Transcript_25557/g.101896 Transcript_25557/m.101896 type:complete len:112 (+) Transcript_25557:847-1182(+)
MSTSIFSSVLDARKVVGRPPGFRGRLPSSFLGSPGFLCILSIFLCKSPASWCLFEGVVVRAAGVVSYLLEMGGCPWLSMETHSQSARPTTGNIPPCTGGVVSETRCRLSRL